MREEYICNGIAETEALGASLTQCTQNAFFALYGDLGAGKTALVRGAAAALGDKSAASPTFSILHEYETNPPMYHFDLYRLSGTEDLEAVGYFDALERSAIIFVEWPSRAGKEIPERHIDIIIDELDAETRKITIDDPCGLLRPAKSI